jgi:3-phenylpropionate/cinnamic acid dioxygenase small subunit
MTSPTTVSAKIVDFINFEADMLDHKNYSEWLDLWTENGFYIVPVDIHAIDFVNTLNFAYDDAEMRRLRVARLQSGESMSTVALDKTIRSVSRFRLIEESEHCFRVRCAMILNEMRAGILLTYPGDVEYELVKCAEGLKIDKKIVRLLHATSHLSTVAFIF